jgi:hypothetical protein
MSDLSAVAQRAKRKAQPTFLCFERRITLRSSGLTPAIAGGDRARISKPGRRRRV